MSEKFECTTIGKDKTVIKDVGVFGKISSADHPKNKQLVKHHTHTHTNHPHEEEVNMKNGLSKKKKKTWRYDNRARNFQDNSGCVKYETTNAMGLEELERRSS